MGSPLSRSDGIIELRSLNCDSGDERELDKMVSTVGRVWNVFSYLSHDSNRGFSSGLSHSVFHQVEHVFIVQQANQVEGTKTGCAAQSEISDNHRAGVKKGKKIRRRWQPE